MNAFSMVMMFGFGALALGVIALLAWAVYYATKCKQAAAVMAAQLGWKPVAFGGKAFNTWFGGVAQGRRVAIRLVGIRSGAFVDNRLGSGAYLRIVMEVARREPLGASALRGFADEGNPEHFEQALRVRNPERFSTRARQAITRFVATGYTPKTPGSLLGRGSGTRNLWVEDRHQAPERFLPKEVLPHARTFVHHDHPDPLIKTEQFGKLLHEMAQVACAIEQGR